MTDISVMTEITAIPVRLPPALEHFVLHWGDMGGQWGVNRSVSQIHALLYVVERPLTAEDIADTLGLARSNVSNSLKELVGWELIRRVPIKGDRREHFEAETDVWEMAARIAKGRKAREVDPALAALRASIAEATGDASVSRVAVQRLNAMLAFTEAVDVWTTQMLGVPKTRLAAAMKLGAKVLSFIPSSKTK
jgi:DNA-binding transcriptional regulator GbsR (MarR family)